MKVLASASLEGRRPRCNSRAVAVRDGRGSRPPQGDGERHACASISRDRAV